MSKKLQMGLASVLAVAACICAPAVAQATPQWYVNGLLQGTSKQNVIVFGTLTMTNEKFGTWKCKVVAGMLVNNENKEGLTNWEGWEPFLCSAPECKNSKGEEAQAYVTAEYPVKLEEKENAKKEIEYTAKRGEKTTPWPGEVITQSGGKTALNTHKMRLIMNCPAETFEPNFTGNLEPHIVNGLGNGLSPSRLVFEPKGGTTSNLNGTWLGGNEVPETQLFVSGELTIIGSSQQLITTE
jgi:hypothetical protein